MNTLTDPTKRRWIAWGALAMVFLLVNIHRLSTAVLSERLTVELTASAAQLGTIHAAFFAIYALMQIPTGILADRIGPRLVGTFGAIVLSVGAVGFALSNGVLGAFVSRAVLGFGSGLIFVSILRFCVNWFRVDEFATMTGLTTGVAGLGAILATTPLALTVDAAGWRPTIVGLAAVGFLSAVGVYVLARDSPKSAGLEPIDDVPDRPTVTMEEISGHLRSLATDVDQWLLSFVYFAAMGTTLTLIGLWGVPYLVVVYEFDVTMASTFTLLASVGMLLGPPTIGWVSDRLERRMLPMAVGMGAFVLSLLLIPVFGRPPVPAVAVSYFLSGFLVGAAVLALPVIKELYPSEASGVATATVNGAGFVGGAIFPTIMGVVLDAYQTDDVVAGTTVYTEFGYRVAFAVVAGIVGFAFLCSVALFVRSQDEVAYR